MHWYLEICLTVQLFSTHSFLCVGYSSSPLEIFNSCEDFYQAPLTSYATFQGNRAPHNSLLLLVIPFSHTVNYIVDVLISL